MMKTISPRLIAVLFACLHASHCGAQPAYVLDPDFRPAVSSVSARGLLPLPNGKFIAHGRFKTADGVDCGGLARFLADGTFDMSFRPSCIDAWLARAILDANDMILVGFNVFDDVLGQGRSQLIRLKPDGSQDGELPTPGWPIVDFAVDLVADDFVFMGPDGRIQRIGRDGMTKSVTGGYGWNAFHTVAPTFRGVLQAFGGTSKGQGEYPPGLLLRRDSGEVSRTYPVRHVASMVVLEYADSVVVAGDGMLQMFDLDGLPVREFTPRFSDGVYNVFHLGDTAGRLIVHGAFNQVNGQNRRGLAILNQDGSVGLEFGPAERGELDGQESSLEFVRGSQGDLFAVGYRRPDTQEFSLVRFLALPIWRSSAFNSGGRFTGVIGCLVGWRYRVEASVDLKQWDTVATGTSMGESVPFADTAPPGTVRRFYRVVKE